MKVFFEKISGIIGLGIIIGIFSLTLFCIQELILDPINYKKFSQECERIGQGFLDRYPGEKEVKNIFFYSQKNNSCIRGLYSVINYEYGIIPFDQTSQPGFIPVVIFQCDQRSYYKNGLYLKRSETYSGFSSREQCENGFNEVIQELKSFDSEKRLI